jgi:20S proteasome subunit beta 4
MECLFGFVGDGFVVVVADTNANQSIVVQKTTEDKITRLDSHKLLGCIGESGDR